MNPPVDVPTTATTDATAQPRHPDHDRKDEETDVEIDTVQDLLTAIDLLPDAERAAARLRVEEAIARPALEARAALGLLALDVTGLLSEPAGQVIVLPEFAQPVAASA